MNLLKSSLQDELDGFFENYKNLDFEKRIVSKAALSKARNNLSHSTFVELNQNLVDQFYKRKRGQVSQWRFTISQTITLFSFRAKSQIDR